MLQCDSSTHYSCLGNLYIADESNNRIRKVTVSTGIITTIAGTGTGSYSGDGGAATSAILYGPVGISVDVTGKPPLHRIKLLGKFATSLSH